jgi:hypothetical protein
MSRPPAFPPQHKPEVASSTKCIHCGQLFFGPRQVLKVGEQPHHRFFKYMAEINGHIVEKHPQQFELASTLGAEFQGMLILMNYESRDPEVLDQRNYYRWKVHQATLKVKIADAAIDRRIAETIDKCFESPTLDFRATMKEHFTKLFRELRDELQEPDAYKLTSLPGDPLAPKPVETA